VGFLGKERLEGYAVKPVLWNAVPTLEGTLPYIVNNEMSRICSSFPNALPDMRSSSTLLLGSDYSGECSGSSYNVYSFLLTSIESWAQWEPERIKIRERHLTQSRRMSFKKLNDGQRRRALLPFLNAANGLNGISLSLAINKKCISFFEKSPPIDLANPCFRMFSKWSPVVLERAVLIIHILGVLIGGLATSGQNILWFTDEDSIAANDERMRELSQLLGWIIDQYLTRDLGHIRCGTSRCDNGTRQIEDYLSIPDLIAGALSEQMIIRSGDFSDFPSAFWVRHRDYTEKTQDIIWWLADSQQPLKRTVCVIDPASSGTKHICRWFNFHDQE
jgi:hypothetical protein